MDTKHITVAIPCYESSEFIAKTLQHPLSDNRIDDIVIVDDGSQDYYDLKKAIVTSDKVRLYRNLVNVGAAGTKRQVVEKSRNEWVVILDADNIIGEDYVDALFSRYGWRNDTIYCADDGRSLPHFKWWDMAGQVVTLGMFRQHVTANLIEAKSRRQRLGQVFVSLPPCVRRLASMAIMRDSSMRFLALMNDGNYLVHRDTYCTIDLPFEPKSADVILFNYLWLKSGKKLVVVPNMSYYHRVHKKSYWMRTSKEYTETVRWIVKDMEAK